MDAFTRSRADEWIDAARSSLLEVRNRNNGVTVVGISMGGALAVLLVGGDPGHFSSGSDRALSGHAAAAQPRGGNATGSGEDWLEN